MNEKNNGVSLTKKILSYSDKSIASFHALPLTKNKLNDDSLISKLYSKLLGVQYLKNEVTYGSDWIDNPIFPMSCIEQSQKETSDFFGSDYTMYLTSGTTCANQIAIFSTINKGDRVLVDRTCHQSIHFALSLIGANIDYSNVYNVDTSVVTNYEQFIFKYKQAKHDNMPYKMVIFNASSYEGRCVNSLKIINDCLQINEKVTFLVDEAWIAFAAFSKETIHMSLLANLDKIKYQRKSLQIIVNQSAHKSLRSLRQGSYLHIVGDNRFINKIKETKYKFHTTSPSFPILASLELARYDIVNNGPENIKQEIDLADELRRHILSMKYFVLKSLNISSEYYISDPLKVIINFERTGIEILKILQILKKQSIYISRYNKSSFLINFHIGVSHNDLTELVNVLNNIEADCKAYNDKLYKLGDISDHYVIPYPPGVPLIVPGEKINEIMLEKIETYNKSHVKIMKVKKV